MNLKHELWMYFGRSHMFFPLFTLFSHFKNGIRVTDKHTDIIIEGYPRCANTFAYVAFRLMQKNKVTDLNIAHHIHGPIQIIKGLKLNIPCILLVRSPIDAVTSLLIRDSNIDPNQAFKNYIKFYEKLLRFSDKIVIADFDLVTENFTKIVEAVNKKYNSSFNEVKIDEDFLSDCRKEVIKMDIRDTGKKVVDKKKVGIPSKERFAIKEQINSDIRENVSSDLINKAQKIYEVFREKAVI